MIKTRVSAIILNPNVLICIYSLSNVPKPRDMYIINTYNSRNLSLSLTVKKKKKKAQTFTFSIHQDEKFKYN